MTAQELYNECFSQVWLDLEASYNAKEVELIFTLDEGGEGVVETDKPVFCNALKHLLSMALTQTLRGTEVHVALGAAKNQCVLTVRDHGPGMSLDQVRALYQLDKLEGLGVGLKLTSREFIDFPDDHGTSVIVTF